MTNSLVGFTLLIHGVLSARFVGRTMWTLDLDEADSGWAIRRSP